MSYSIDEIFPDADSPAVQVANAVRDLALLLVTADASDDLTRAVATSVQAQVDALRSEPSRPPVSFTDDLAGAKRASGLFNPVIGWGNPFSPRLHMTFEPDGTAVGSVVMSKLAEGPPGAVHGGWVAMLLDQVLGHANAAARIGAFTAQLTVTYRKPTPLDVPLSIRARTEDIDGRKVRTRGQIVANDEVTAEAEGLFITWPTGSDLPRP